MRSSKSGCNKSDNMRSKAGGMGREVKDKFGIDSLQDKSSKQQRGSTAQPASLATSLAAWTVPQARLRRCGRRGGGGRCSLVGEV